MVIESGYKLIHNLFTKILKEAKTEWIKWRPGVDQPIWANVVAIAFVIHELIMNSGVNAEAHTGQIKYHDEVKAIKEYYYDSVLKIKDSNGETYSAIFQISENWILDDLFMVLDSLWTPSLFETTENFESKETKILSILSRTSDDDFIKDVELLLYNGNKDKKSTSVFNNDCFLKCILNLATLKISHVQNKANLSTWLNILLRICKFLLLASETQSYNFKDQQIISSNTKISFQKYIAKSLIFIIAFLYREILKTYKKELWKLLTSWLEEIIISWLVTAEYSSIKYTPQQLKQSSHKTASREVLIILRFCQPKLVSSKKIGLFDQTEKVGAWPGSEEGEPLISQSQIDQLKLENYENVGKVIFSNDKWRDTMLNSDIIEEIIQEFVSFGSVEGGKSEYEASNHAKNTLQMEKAAEATIEKKSKKIHSDIMDVIDTVIISLSKILSKLIKI